MFGDGYDEWDEMDEYLDFEESIEEGHESEGCYIATAVYGSYDCPPVWTLRRFRDEILKPTWYGRAFIKFYYKTSPTLVKWFGKMNWFNKFFRGILDPMVDRLNKKFES